MTDTAAQAGYVGKLPILTKVAHGIGLGAVGVKDNGFVYFLFFFYTVVLKVDAFLVGLALFIALVFDAISDPIIGYISDNWRSKWGRRHPFMYASALPVALCYFLIWQPPAGSDFVKFLYLTGMAILIRTLISFFQTPSSALNAELTQDYDERSSLAAYRLYFAWTLGNLMTVFAFGVLFASNDPCIDGRIVESNYTTYGIIGSVLIFLFIIISSLGTHSRIPHMPPPPPKRKMTIVSIFKEVFETLSEKSFAAIFGAYLFGAIASGVSATFAFQMLTFFWEFSTAQIAVYTACVFVSAFLGFLIAPTFAKALGKKKAILTVGVIAFSVAPLPYLLRLIGWFPDNTDPVLFPLLLVILTLDLGFIIALQALLTAMVADLVEQSQVKTGRRSEGLFFAAVTFIRKSTLGLGGFFAGTIATVSGFSAALKAGNENLGPDQCEAVPKVSEDVLWNLGALYVPTLWILYSLLLICLLFYKIDKDSHEENLRKLAERSAAE